MRGLRALRAWDRLVVHDTDPQRAAAFAHRHGGTVLPSPRQVAAEASTVVLATWARTPLLHADDLKSGQHLTSLGSDEPGKQELAPGVLTSARLIVDDVALVAAHGALAGAGLPASTAAASLSEILRGQLPARTTSRRSPPTPPSDCPGRTWPWPGWPTSRPRLTRPAPPWTCCPDQALPGRPALVPICVPWRYAGTERRVLPEELDRLRRRAALAGKSLTAHAHDVLMEEAERIAFVEGAIAEAVRVLPGVTERFPEGLR